MGAEHGCPDRSLRIVEEHHVGHRPALIVERDEDDAFPASHRGNVRGAADAGDEDFDAAGQVDEF